VVVALDGPDAPAKCPTGGGPPVPPPSRRPVGDGRHAEGRGDDRDEEPEGITDDEQEPLEGARCEGDHEGGDEDQVGPDQDDEGPVYGGTARGMLRGMLPRRPPM
jgi:hypothetical protein